MDWPSTGGVDGRRLAESLRDGDSDALTWIWDAYAMRLYDYCHGLLRNQEAAADAVHDTLIVAKERIAGLRQLDRFRGWLYAIARKECMRRRGDPHRPPNVVVAPEATDEVIDSEEWAKREETRRQVHSALSTLTGDRREIIDLGTRHELEPQELAPVLGLSVSVATELFQRASDELGSRLTVIVGDEVSVPRMLHILPIADIPTGLWTRIRETATDPERAAERMVLAERAEPFDSLGWPASDLPPAPSRSAPRIWTAVASAVGVLVVAGVVVAFLPADGGHDPVLGDRSRAPRPVGDTPPSSLPPGFEPRSGSPTPTTSSTTPATPTAHGSPPSRKGAPSPRRSRPQPQPPSQGTPVVSGCDMSSGDTSCTVTVSARGGTVNWAVTGTSDQLSASGGGTLPAGQTAEITVERHGLCIFGGSGSVSFAPAGSAPVNWTC